MAKVGSNCLTKQAKESREFKALLERYNCAVDTLSLAIYTVYPQLERDLSSNDLKSKLDDYFKLRTAEYSEREFDAVKKAYDTIKITEFKNKGKALIAYKRLSEFFGKENVIMHSSLNGTTIVRVAVPILKSAVTKQDIFNNQSNETLINQFIQDRLGNYTILDIEDGKVFTGFPKGVVQVQYSIDHSVPAVVFEGNNNTKYLLGWNTRDGVFELSIYDKKRGSFYHAASETKGSESDIAAVKIAIDKFLPKEFVDYVRNKAGKDGVKDSDFYLERFNIPLFSPTYVDREGNVVAKFELRNTEFDNFIKQSLNSSDKSLRSIPSGLESGKELGRTSENGRTRNTKSTKNSATTKSKALVTYGGGNKSGLKKEDGTPKMYGIVSQNIGNTVDEVCRDYFLEKLKPSYPNLTSQHLHNLVEDLKKLEAFFKKKYGDDCIIVTDEFPIAAKYTITNKNGKSEIKYIAGTVDMIVIDSDGNSHLYDMKAKRSGFTESNLTEYGNQQGLYKKILDTQNFPIEDTHLIHFLASKSKYEAPVDAGDYAGTAVYDAVSTGTKTLQVYITLPGKKRVKLLNDPSKKYTGPRLYMSTSFISGEEYITDDTFVPVELDTSDDKMLILLEQLSLEDRSLAEEEYGSAKDIKKKKEVSFNEASSIEFSKKEKDNANGLYNNTLISAGERKFLANQIMYESSFIITHLLSSKAANEYYFGSLFAGKDFTTMSRLEIIKAVGIGRILNWVKENRINPSSDSNLELIGVADDSIFEKFGVAYEYFSDLINEGYSKLIKLEGATIIPASTEEIILDYGDEDFISSNDAAILEEKEREYWQLGLNHISATGSLSAEIKRLFGRLKAVDNAGNTIPDKFGFGFDTFVDEDAAIGNVFQWTKGCTTVEEMIEKLEEKAERYPYINSILQKINSDDALKSLFFQNFRKDFVNYSIITTRVNDKTGKIEYVVTIVNTKGAANTIMSDVTNQFNSGTMSHLIQANGSVDGKGRVNVEMVTRIQKYSLNLGALINSNLDNKGKLSKILKNNSVQLARVLNMMGITVSSLTVLAAIEKDIEKTGNTSGMAVFTILNKIKYITGTLLENKDNTKYNPITKGEKGNVFSDYKTLVGVLAQHIEDRVESSVYENGKMYYSFVTPSYMGNLIVQLKDSIQNPAKFAEYIQKNYAKYRWFGETIDGEFVWHNEWLRLILESDEWRGKLDHKILLHYEGTEYTKLSELGYTLSLMHEYFSDNDGKRNIAWYRVPILSNKPSSEFIKFRRYSGNDYKRQIKRGLKGVFNQEILRIKTVLERAVNQDILKILSYDIDLDLLKGTIGDKAYQALILRIKARLITAKDLITISNSMATKNKKSGAEFHFLEALNKEFSNSKSLLSGLIVDKINGKKTDDAAIDKILVGGKGGRDRGLIDDIMDVIVENETSKWKELGLFSSVEETNEKGLKTRKYTHLSTFGKSLEEINDNLEEYVWNDMFATINIIQLTATDLAYYKNMEDFQKRYAQVHSPTMKLNTTAEYKGLRVSDGYSRTIYIKDYTSKGGVKSEIINNVKVIFSRKIDEATSPAEKQQLKIMRDSIISAFEKDLNVTDALGYSSPTAYRKKMVMAGKWKDEMEEAYEKIRSGNYSAHDLGVVWLPLKPFVYSLIPKTSGSKTMSEIKVSIQNKNSEYMLLIADALMRGEGQKSTLGAIFDFMENSAYDGRIVKNGKVIRKGTYNKHGIDTVLFESAVKSGLMGTIDINNMSYSEIQKELSDKVYYSNDKMPTTSNDNDVYNDQYVHTIPFEDYGIQQEVPAHMTDHFQAMGSLVRILSVSDISKNARFQVHNWNGQNDGKVDSDYLIKRYQSLIAANIRSSFDKLCEDLKLNGSRRLKNKALSELLTLAILKDQRYGADLLRACLIDENTGEFIIPLQDPVQSLRIQQLIHSIIKTRINKLEVQGGPVVLASVYGVSEDLKIVFNDKNGNPLRAKQQNETDEHYLKYLEDHQASLSHMEVYMPIPTEAMERALTKPNGELMDILEAIDKKIIDPEQLKAIGYRIPTEDKYSMIPMKIKGFLPKSAGEALMMPKEITLLTGSDFDIDKIYVMFKEFRHNNKVNFSKLSKEILNAYLAKYGKLSEKEYNVAKASLEEKYNGKSIITTKGSQKYQDMMWRLSGAYDENVEKFTLRSFLEITKDVLKKENTGTRNNEIFDILWAVLTHEDTMSKMFNPGSFDVLKKTARIILALELGVRKSYNELNNMSLSEIDALLKPTTNNIVLSSTQVAFHKQNMTAGKLIGIFANNNVSHAFISLKSIHFMLLDNQEFTLAGHTVSKSSNNRIDSQKGFDGTLISKNIAGFLAASVDAVKDPVLNYMNLNTFTSGPAMVLARLGFDSDTIGLLMSLPIIKLTAREFFRLSNEDNTPAYDVIRLELDRLFPNKWRMMSKNVSATNFSKEKLAEAIANGTSSDLFLGMVLLLFSNLNSMADDLNDLTFLTKFNSISNAAGPSIAQTFVLRERVNKFMDRMHSSRPPFSPNAARILDKDDGNDTILHAFYDCTVGENGAPERIMKDHFSHFSSTFKDIVSRIRQNTRLTLDDKTINSLYNDFMFYILTEGDNPVINTSKEYRERFIKEFPQYFKEKAAGVVDNALINIITITNSDSKCPVPTIGAKTGGFNADQQEKIKTAWSSLMENPETFELGRNLFIYNLYRSGFTFSPKTFLHLASVDVKLSMGAYIDAIKDKGLINNASIERFIVLYVRNNSHNSKIVPKLKKSSSFSIKEGVHSKDKVPTITIKSDKYGTGINSIVIKSIGETFTLAPFITYNNKLWYTYDTEILAGQSVMYTELGKLGNRYNFLEYNANESGATMESVINKSPILKLDKEGAENDPGSSEGSRRLHKDYVLTDEELRYLFAEEGPLSEYYKLLVQTYKGKPNGEVLFSAYTKTLIEQKLKEKVKKKSVENKLKEILKHFCKE